MDAFTPLCQLGLLELLLLAAAAMTLLPVLLVAFGIALDKALTGWAVHRERARLPAPDPDGHE